MTCFFDCHRFYGMAPVEQASTAPNLKDEKATYRNVVTGRMRVLHSAELLPVKISF